MVHWTKQSLVNTGRYADNCILYLSWDLELLHHPHIKEAADTTLDEFKLWQGEIAEVELMQLHGLGVRDICFLHVRNMAQRLLGHLKQCVLMGCIAVCTSQRLPTAYTSPFGHSLLVQSQTSLQCSAGDDGQFVYLFVFTVAEVISANWGKSLPEWSVHQPPWPLSGTWAFPGQPLFSTPSCLVCHMCHCSGWTSQGTELAPDDTSKKHQVTLTHISRILKVFRKDKQENKI